MNNVIEHDTGQAIEAAPTNRLVSTATTPMDLLAKVDINTIDPAKLQQLLDVQKSWEENEARKAYHRAMAAFRSKPLNAAKDTHVFYRKGNGDVVDYWHASLASMVKAATIAMSEHGLYSSWRQRQLENGNVEVTCVIAHADGYSEQTSMNAPPDTSGGKNLIQGIASTNTYLERYTLQALTGIAAEDMPDADDVPAPGSPMQQGGPQEKPVERGTLESYSEKAFAANEPAWSTAFAQGRATAESLIAMMGSRFDLTDDQKDRIHVIYNEATGAN